MSGEFLRTYAQRGDWQRLQGILKNRANTCSQDEFGITALMYAVWNGHIECVKYLICNDFGVNSMGIKCSSLSLVSCKGFTALHLAALDCPYWSCKEITLLLLIANVDQTIKDGDGKIAIELAQSNDNKPALEAFNDFNTRNDETFATYIENIKEKLLKKYTFHRELSNHFDVVKWNANFPIPSWLLSKQRSGYIPYGMRIHEHQIKPMIQFGSKLESINAFHSLQFTTDQADANHERRKQINDSLSRGQTSTTLTNR